jgi:hypothetical protein
MSIHKGRYRICKVYTGFESFKELSSLLAPIKEVQNEDLILILKGEIE